MKKTGLLSILAVAVQLTIGVAAEAQQPKVPKVGRLSPTSLASDGQREFLGRELRPLGYVDGKNITIEYRYADNKVDRLPVLANELVSLKVDVILVVSTPAAIAAKNATKTIPIVFFNVGNPVDAGLIDSLARPGGNLTGLTNLAVDLAGKRLELLKETI